MSVTLSSQNSKFMKALESRVGEKTLAGLVFDHAEISDNSSVWTIYFISEAEVSPEIRDAVKTGILAIIPRDVSLTLNFAAKQEQPTNAEPVPVPPAAPTPENEDAALKHYLERMQKMQRDASAQIKERAARSPKSSMQAAGNEAIYGRDFAVKNVTEIKNLSEISGNVVICGDIVSVEEKPLKKGAKTIVIFVLTDYTSSITCKAFIPNKPLEAFRDKLNGSVAVRGQCVIDKFNGELTLMFNDIMPVKRTFETDDAPQKRVELHLHTRMSQMDGVVDPSALVSLMQQYGHDAVAITDHGVVQAYPEIEKAIKKKKADIKVIFGVEAYLLDDDTMISLPDENVELKNLEYVVFDLETTGLSCLTCKIIEIGAVKYKNGVRTEEFSTLVNPEEPLSPEISKLTAIHDSMLREAPTIAEVLPAFLKFCENSIMVAHNADFDMSFIRTQAVAAGYSFDKPQLDTLRLSRELLTELKTFKLNKVCDHLGIRLENHHRAVDDADACACIFMRLLSLLEARGIKTAAELNANTGKRSAKSYHCIIYAQNNAGLFNLYQLITASHLDYLQRKRPHMPRSLVNKHREGLIIASACEQGELYQAILEGEHEYKLEKIANFYDYLEIQPLGNNQFLVDEHKVHGVEQLIEINKKIIELGEKLHKPVIATGDVHFLRKRDAVYRSIIMCAEGFKNADVQPPLYYRTTQEMLDEFYYLPESKRREVVIDNPRALAESCNKMESFPRDKLYTPSMDGAEDELRTLAETKAHAIYGKTLPPLVYERLEHELNAIIHHGYAVLYIIAQRVVAKSLSDGYIVGSRGSVGSSFVATMTNITEVNPLQPHYVCPACQYSDFDIDLSQYDCGIDLPEKNCPVCGERLLRLGFNIPFEVFMGFDGDKVPDIDLNFSGEYQSTVHKYIEELFGSEYVFRAGTIGGVAEKTALGYARKYCSEYGLHVPNAEIQRLAQGCIEVKRTTGQHPAGMVILPKGFDINQFTPLQYPANDPDKGVITTHFAFEFLHDTILKADILGHDDPTMIKMLEDLTDVNVMTVPLDDKKVMSLFLSPEALGVSAEEICTPVGTYGIPEFGTAFTQKMLVETKPTTFSDLVKISGLSHGTDVWTGNAEDLINSGTTTLKNCICTREDIMNMLMQSGCEKLMSFKAMELVRKKGSTLTPEMEVSIREHGIPEWFIDSCHKISYMFPKAHAAAYVTMAVRICYYKVYYPTQYYIAYFTVRADDFDINLVNGSPDSLRALIAEYQSRPSLNPREKGILVIIELALEMKCRGIDFADIDIYKSEATKFKITDDGRILPPLTAVAGLGETAAYSIVEARQIEPFKSQEDLLLRTKLSSTLLDALDESGCLQSIPKSVQISLFDFEE